ncbi:BZ3500_MvSof-1268-A1-R1_Chr3-1g05768 [Microbotryum saponariae]|uniref:BZ3500_MvSof-1268-A1-R1_Chr3-1g05768 protein n=1 Tax=Microbotryum saponariae TaxID=289078 RepID=A0A2X0MWV7_9BASI|nr:BZ3500_MvSof-1268-A1-R1_Chr3-1g05768 [Microbotryum saponariae]SDA04958.1 BZ3501_MvSof-1269-A2-R1_Chr3-1g05438 [Microbotryum saponariae]
MHRARLGSPLFLGQAWRTVVHPQDYSPRDLRSHCGQLPRISVRFLWPRIDIESLGGFTEDEGLRVEETIGDEVFAWMCSDCFWGELVRCGYVSEGVSREGIAEEEEDEAPLRIRPVRSRLVEQDPIILRFPDDDMEDDGTYVRF